MECSTIDEVREKITEHAKDTFSSDLRVFVFVGKILPITTSDDLRKPPTIEVSGGKKLPLLKIGKTSAPEDVPDAGAIYVIDEVDVDQEEESSQGDFIF